MNLSEKLSQRFTLKDLTVTSTGIPNFPDATALAKLRTLAQTLDQIYARIGPFSVVSAYRSPAVQNAIKGGAAGATSAQMAATNSLHSTGEAADIAPLGMDLNTFFVRIISDQTLMQMLGQVVLKDSQGALHVSTPNPRFPAGTPMKVVSGGAYVRMSTDEIKDFLSKYKVAGVSIAIVAALAGGLFFLTRAIQERAGSQVTKAVSSIKGRFA